MVRYPDLVAWTPGTRQWQRRPKLRQAASDGKGMGLNNEVTRENPGLSLCTKGPFMSVIIALLLAIAMVAPAPRRHPRRYIKDHQIAQTYNISLRTVHRYLAAGVLKAYRVGPKMIRFDADEVERALIGKR
jgi:excisionase family DNA binding protein